MNRRDAEDAENAAEKLQKDFSCVFSALSASLRFSFVLILLFAFHTGAQVLDKQKILDRQTFWDNRDWEWYKQNIPFFESPDSELDTTYYYRWELVTKHMVYASPATGYVY